MIGEFLQGWTPLVAQTPDFTALGRKFRGEDAQLGWGDLAIGLAIVVGIGLLIWLLKRLSAKPSLRRAINRPDQLFDALCRAHGLGRAERRLLRGLARSHGLTQPARLFVEPRRFDLQHLPATMRRFEADLLRLRDRLFA